MISFVFGLVLLIIPFLAVALFKDKKPFDELRVGWFVFVLFFSIVFHVALAIITQMLGIFYYGVIIGFTFIADLILLFFVFRFLSFPRKRESRERELNSGSPIKSGMTLKKIDWALMFVVVVGFLTLYQVHYNYTGKINIATDKHVMYHQASNMQYVYPYFSDEWYSVALIKNSIENHTLPITNPFDNSFFLNLELFFHSFLAEIILILNLDPLTQYAFLSIFFNLLILVLAYIFLRINNLPCNISAISALCLLYITYGANMPGLWNLIPFNMGIIFCLIMFVFISLKDFKMTFFASILGSLFYPPLFVFYLLGLVFMFFEKYKNNKDFLLKVLGYLFILFVFLPVIYLILMISPLSNATNYIFSRLFFISFTAPYIPNFAIYNMMLWPIILLAIIGLLFVFKGKKWLFFQFILGSIMWIIYSFTINRFMIEYERIVILTSIIITIISGFGLNEIVNKFKYLKYINIVVLLLFLLFVPLYTQRESWKNLTLLESQSGFKGTPKAPANNYLTEDDLRIFENIKNVKFLSIPWKGTVIGTATNNYAVVTKEGTISMGKENIVNNFLNADCANKEYIALSLKVDYVYLYDFVCPSFEKQDKSKEGLILYKFKKWKN